MRAKELYEGYLIKLGDTARQLGVHQTDQSQQDYPDIYLRNTTKEVWDTHEEVGVDRGGSANSSEEDMEQDRRSEINSATESTRTPKNRTPQLRNVPVYTYPELRFLEPLRDLTLSPDSTVEVICEAVGSTKVHVFYTPRDLTGNTENVRIVKHSETKVSATFVEVRQ